MFSIEYDDIELEWHSDPPAIQSQVERVIRHELREHVVPLTPEGLMIFIQYAGLIFMVYGMEASTAYHCMWL
jgi:hypothetical protein